MKSIFVISIPAVLILLGMTVWTHYTQVLGGTFSMSSMSIHESKTFEVAQAPTLIIESDAGNVQLVGGTGGSVRVEAEKHAPTVAEAEKMTYSVEDRADTIRIVYRDPDRSHHDRHIDFKIQAPADSVLQVTTGGGNIDASGFSQGITGHTGGGNVRAANMAGTVRLNTGGGNIDGGGLNGTVDLSTGGGNIGAFGDLRGSVALATGGGNISAESVSGEVKAQTGAGNIFVGGSLTGNCQLSTGAGNIDAIVPADSNLSIHAATSMGHIHDGFGLNANTAQMHGPTMLSGQIGSGANNLNIRTGIGNVSLQKR
jgi:DUF4097 and DUF4098 domain-containing protein YvlB